MSQYPILQTKLYIPPIRPELVSRPRLLEQLKSGLDRKLTVISAPAGFGKTTLVTQWLKSVQCPSTWLSLDERDNDPMRFLAYFVAALRTVDANIGKGALSALEAPQPPPTEALLTTLLNEIATISDRIVLVLDDYHLIEARAIHEALTFLLEHLPLQMHLVIATRDDPHLPLARLRARGQLTEVRAADLRFSSSEAAEFLNRVMGLTLSTEDIAALETRTEGWIAGLQLAALALQGTLSMQGHKDISSRIKSFTGSHRFVMDYLVEEILQQQSDHARSFLLQTSILNHLCGSLCDAVRFGSAKSSTGQQDGRNMLEALERGNLFVVPLDDQRQWYRYHHLFADVLQVHLMEEQAHQVPSLHRRASEWYEQNGSPPDAIRHALAADDFERAASLTELAWPAWSEPVQTIAWLGWVKALPDELVRDRPVLSVAYAQALLNAGELEAAEARLQDVEQWLKSMSDQPEDSSTETCPEQSRRMVVVDETQFRSLPVSLATTRAYHAQAIGDAPGTAMYTRQVLDLLPESDHYMRGSVTMLLGLAYWASGDLDKAHRTFSDGVASMKKASKVLDAIDFAFVLADMKMVLGHLHEAVRTCEHALQLATKHVEPMPRGTEDVYTEISKLHLEQGNLEAAAQNLSTARKIGEQVEVPDWQSRWYIAQARLQETLGDLAVCRRSHTDHDGN